MHIYIYIYSRNEEYDYIFRDFFEEMQQKNVLNRLSVAFSRDTKTPGYIYICIYMYVRMYMYLYVFICVCM